MPLPPRIAQEVKRPICGPLLCYVVAQSFYLYTIAPTLLWGDDAKFQWMAYLRDTQAGAEYDHPFWIIVAHPFTQLPIGDVAFRATLWTSIWAAVAVALVYAVLRRLTKSGWAAAVGAATLMVSHTFWTHAVRAEVYSLSMALLAGSMLCVLLPRRSMPLLLLGALLAGLGANNHTMGWLFVPGLAVLAAWRVRQEGLSLWLLVAAAACAAAPTIAFRRMIPGQWSPPLDVAAYIPTPAVLVREGAKFVAYAALQVPSAAAALAAIGAVAAWRTREVGLALLLIAGANVTSALNHDVADKFVFYLPTYLVMALWAGMGAQQVLGWATRRRGPPQRMVMPGLLVGVLVLPIAAYAAAPHVLPTLGVTSEALSIREIPGRPALRFFLNPNRRHYTGAREFCEAALTGLAPDATLIVDYTVWEPLLYLQRVEGLRSDVRVALVTPGRQVQYARDASSSRPVYVALLEPGEHYDRRGLESAFRIVPAGVVYRLEPPAGSS